MIIPSPFPHGTGSLSVSGEYLALADGPARFTQDFSCPELLRILLKITKLPIRDFHPLWWRFPTHFRFFCFFSVAVLQPRDMHCYISGLGFCAFARHYSRNHFLFSSPKGNEMFQFPSFAFHLKWNDTASLCRVAPFGNPGINGYLHLTRAFRSLSRPSSPPRA